MFEQPHKEETHWPSISDLMSGLMLVFLLIAIAYMHNVDEGQKRIKKVAVAYQETQVSLYNSLLKEFKNDLPRWKAKIDQETLSVQFMEPDVLFKTGSADVKPAFKKILNDFFLGILRLFFHHSIVTGLQKSELKVTPHLNGQMALLPLT